MHRQMAVLLEKLQLLNFLRQTYEITIEKYFKPLFCDDFFCALLEMNWFAATNFRNQGGDYMETETQEIFWDQFPSKNIRKTRLSHVNESL